jgi:hypothetical protein
MRQAHGQRTQPEITKTERLIHSKTLNLHGGLVRLPYPSAAICASSASRRGWCSSLITLKRSG